MKLIPDATKLSNFSVVSTLRFGTFKVLVMTCLPPLAALFLLPPAHGQIKRPQSNAGDKKTSPCALKLNDSPGIKGLRLGLTVAEFLKIFPSAKDTSAGFETEVGEKSFQVNSKENSDFAGIDVTAVKFVDEEMSFLSLTYMNFEAGGNLNALIRQITSSLNLPTDIAWQSGGGKATKNLNCLDFSLTISSGDYGFRQELPYLLLEDKLASAKIAARRKAMETGKRRKP